MQVPCFYTDNILIILIHSLFSVGCAAQTEAEPGSRLQTHLHLRVPQINDPERSGQKEKVGRKVF